MKVLHDVNHQYLRALQDIANEHHHGVAMGYKLSTVALLLQANYLITKIRKKQVLL